MVDVHETPVLGVARCMGERDGRAAASWYFDGNTPEHVYAEVLRGIEGGDPLVMDTLPWLDLSGQWADGTDERAVVASIRADDEGVSADDDAIIDAYREAYDAAVLEAIEASCRHHAAPEG